MIACSIDITINRPLDEVFDYLTDASNHPKWDPGSLELEPQEPGAWRKGLRFREVRQVAGRRMETQSEIAEFDPNHIFIIKGLTGPEFTGYWRFELGSNGTNLRWNCEMKMSGIARLFEPMIQRQMQKDCDRNFANLKQILEHQN